MNRDWFHSIESLFYMLFILYVCLFLYWNGFPESWNGPSDTSDIRGPGAAEWPPEAEGPISIMSYPLRRMVGKYRSSQLLDVDQLRIWSRDGPFGKVMFDSSHLTNLLNRPTSHQSVIRAGAWILELGWWIHRFFKARYACPPRCPLWYPLPG